MSFQKGSLINGFWRDISYNSLMESPKNDPVAILDQINLLQREPFRKELARMLDCAPTKAALRKFANKSPDRWAQAIAILSKASGYQDKVINETNIYMRIEQLPDAGLEHELLQVEEQLKKLTKQQIAGETIYVPKESGEEENNCEGTEEQADNQQEVRHRECQTDS